MFIIFLLGTVVFETKAQNNNMPERNWSQWSEWNSFECAKKLFFRIRYYETSSKGLYNWQIEFRNDYSEDLYFNYGLEESYKTHNLYGAESIQPIKANSTYISDNHYYVWQTNTNKYNEVDVYIFHVCMGKDNWEQTYPKYYSECNSKEIETFTDDRDGKKYKTIKIVNQIWMAENLNYFTSSGSWCFDNNSSNCNTYGRLYNWVTAQNVCPIGWHLPSKGEFETLLSNVGGSSSNAYYALKDAGSSGFNALLGGYLESAGNYFTYIGDRSLYCSSSEYKYNNDIYIWVLGVYKSREDANVHICDPAMGFSVRCLHD